LYPGPPGLDSPAGTQGPADRTDHGAGARSRRLAAAMPVPLPLPDGTSRVPRGGADASGRAGAPGALPSVGGPRMSLLEVTDLSKHYAGRPSLGDRLSGKRRTLVRAVNGVSLAVERGDRKSTRLNSSHVKTSYAVFCLKK